ncbi:hypothetical protein ACVWY2_004105 [Bradyrhizobium sp. JR6.1]
MNQARPQIRSHSGRELAEMGRSLDRAAAEAELLRGCIVVNRGVGVVGLGLKHLLRAAPGTHQQIAVLHDFRRECGFDFNHPWSPFARHRFKEAGVRQASQSKKASQSNKASHAQHEICAAAMERGCSCITKSVHADA